MITLRDPSLLRIARARLRSQRIDAGPLERAVDVVRWLVASQAQDFAGAKWALGLRMRDASDAAVEREFDQGAILRTHMMRPTWHFVAREDIRWMLALTAPHVNAVNAHRYRQLELDGGTFSKANRVFARALEGGRQLTRHELREELARARVGALEGQRLAYVLMRAELDAVICSGARRGKQFTYALLDERALRARTLPRDVALADLAGRYFRSRGPASVQDFSKWSGLPAVDARAGTEAIAPKLEREVIGGRTYWSGGSAPTAPRGHATAHLLSIYDEFISSYRDRSALCYPEYVRRLVGMGNALAYLVVMGGRVAGTWRRTTDQRAIRVQITPFWRLSAAERRTLETAAGRFAAFVDRELVMEVDGAVRRSR